MLEMEYHIKKVCLSTEQGDSGTELVHVLESNLNEIFLPKGSKIPEEGTVSFMMPGRVCSSPTAKSIPLCHVGNKLFHLDPLCTPSLVSLESGWPGWIIPKNLPDKSDTIIPTVSMECWESTMQWNPHCAGFLPGMKPEAKKAKRKKAGTGDETDVEEYQDIKLYIYYLEIDVANLERFANADNELLQDVPLMRSPSKIENAIKEQVTQQKKLQRLAAKLNAVSAKLSKDD